LEKTILQGCIDGQRPRKDLPGYRCMTC